MRPRRQAGPALLASLLVLSAARPVYAQTDPSDPWERTNRKIFHLNENIDRRILGPAAAGYSGLPGPLRSGLRNFSRNMRSPVVFINDVLQGHPGQAATTVGRFAINTLFGIGGLMDVASAGNVPYHSNSFGLTLGRWGVGPGPYVILPVLGPSTVRDAFGGAVDMASNPISYVSYPGDIEVGVVTTVSTGLDKRAEAGQELVTIRETSTDPYATLRSYYLQNRQAEVTGKPVDIQDLPAFDAPLPPPGTPLPTPQTAAPDLSSPPANASGPGAASTPAPTPPPQTQPGAGEAPH